jgi:hypothetical protein
MVKRPLRWAPFCLFGEDKADPSAIAGGAGSKGSCRDDRRIKANRSRSNPRLNFAEQLPAMRWTLGWAGSCLAQ